MAFSCSGIQYLHLDNMSIFAEIIFNPENVDTEKPTLESKELDFEEFVGKIKELSSQQVKVALDYHNLEEKSTTL